MKLLWLSALPNIFLHKSPLRLPLSSAPCSLLPDQYPAEGSDTVYFGKPNPSQEQCDALDLDICPDLLLAAIAAAGAAAFIALYVALTMQQFGRKKRRRSLDHEPHEYFSHSDIAFVGMLKKFHKILVCKLQLRKPSHHWLQCYLSEQLRLEQKSYCRFFAFTFKTNRVHWLIILTFQPINKSGT